MEPPSDRQSPDHPAPNCPTGVRVSVRTPVSARKRAPERRFEPYDAEDLDIIRPLIAITNYYTERRLLATVDTLAAENARLRHILTLCHCAPDIPAQHNTPLSQ